VTDSLMHFVKNKEELAGVLCHETSHDIHHDVMNLNAQDQRLSAYATVLSLLLGGRNMLTNSLTNSLINELANVQSLHYSRNVEEAADQKGAQTCAQAGFDPYGLVWLMQQFQSANLKSPPEFLSDHPSDAHRIAALQAEFAADPSTFGRFNPNISCGTPLTYGGFYDQYNNGCGVTRKQPGVP